MSLTTEKIDVLMYQQMIFDWWNTFSKVIDNPVEHQQLK